MRATLSLLAVALTAVVSVVAETTQLPIFFVETATPGSNGTRFVARGSAVTAHFSSNSVQFRVGQGLIRLTFPNANPAPRLIGEDPRQGRVNFLVGDAEQWQTDLATYGGVAYRGLYPGIDLRYGATGRVLKSEFVVAPGAAPSAIRMRYEGAENPRVLSDGALCVMVGGEQLREEPPVAYQEIGASRWPVEVRFVVSDDGTVGFQLGAYDPANTLVIDPELSYSTLLGGRGMDTVLAVAADASGNVYVAGRTDSYDLPVVNGAQSGSGGGTDAFVAKLNATGNALVYCTYIGGTADDRAFAIAIDTIGSAHVAGATYSTNFPVRNALQSRRNGTRNAFVLKLNATGNALAFSTYLGGSGSDAANSIAVDPSGSLYVAGDTTSSNFPATGYQQSSRGLQDGFVIKIRADGAQIVYSTYLGGSSDDHIAALAVDATGVVSVTGSTYSTDLPASTGQRSSGGASDAWIARLSAAGNALIFCSYLGGSSGVVGVPEEGKAVAIDAAGNMYVAGVTGSANFPLVRALQTKLRGMMDAFVAVFSPTGVMTYSSFLGGSGVESANAIGVTASGELFVAGDTTSADFPVVSPVQGSNGGDYDAFLIRMNAARDAITYASYLGGNGADTALALAIDPAANIYVGGQTLSTNFPFLRGVQSTNPGNFGGFVSKWIFNAQPVPVSVSPAAGTGAAQVFRLQFTDPLGAGSISTASILVNTSATVSGGCAVIFNRTLNTLTVLTDTGNTPSWVVTPGGSGTVENTQCSVAGVGSSFSINGPSLTLDVALTFKPAFSGTKNVYLQATSPSGSSGWQMLGGWTAGNPVSAIRLAATQFVAGSTLIGNQVLASSAVLQDTVIALTSSHPAVLVPSTLTIPSGATSAAFPILTKTVTSATLVLINAVSAGQTFAATVLLLPASSTNLALGKTTSQSSLAAPEGESYKAVDGNTDGHFPNASVTHTSGKLPNAWWQVDLGASSVVNEIVIWNRTDCCTERLTDYWVFVSDTPFAANDTPANLAGRTGTWGTRQTTSPSPATRIALPGIQGRYVRVQQTGTVILSLAEVQVMGWTVSLTNLALGRLTTQSSLSSGGGPSGNAVDGNTDGTFGNGSVTQTSGKTATSWWQVDLGSSGTVTEIILWNRTDCCAERLSDYWVFVSETPFNANDTPATLQTRAGTWSTHLTAQPNPIAALSLPNLKARYVRVQLAAPGILSMAEVQVMGWPATLGNLALGRPTSQSATPVIGADSSKAVDGITDGFFGNGSVTHTTGLIPLSWWQVDLGSSSRLTEVIIWNRTDCCAERLSDYWVFVSDAPFGVNDTVAGLQSRAGTWSSHQTSIPSASTRIPMPGVRGRYLRVQQSRSGILSLAEVQILGSR